MSTVEDLVNDLRQEAPFRWFGTKDPKTQTAIRHGYLLALEEIEGGLKASRQAAGSDPRDAA